MIKSKFIDILKTFSPEEIKSFSEFLRSPFFNKSVQAFRLFDLLVKYRTHLNDGVSKEKIYGKLYPGKKYNDERMRNLFSDLYRLSEEFITLNGFRNNDKDFQNHLLKALRNRKLNRLFAKGISNAFENLQKTSFKDEYYYQSNYLLQDLKIDYMLDDISIVDLREIQKFHDNMFDYFLIRLLRSYLLLLYTQKNYPSYNFKLNFLSEVIGHIKSNGFEDAPLIEIYYNMILLLLENREEYFVILKKLLSKHYGLLGRNEIYGMYFHLINFCIHKKDTTFENIKYEKQLFDLYKTIVSRKIYRINEVQHFDHLLFNNIVTNALKVKEYDWTEKFLNNYKDELSPEQILSTYHICYASLFTSKGEFQKALDILSKMRVSGYFYEIKIKFLLMKIYCELEYFDLIAQLSDSFKHFLNQNKSVNLRYKILYTNFINLTNKLVKIKLNGKKDEASYFEKEVRSTENLIGRDWLLEKAKELA